MAEIIGKNKIKLNEVDSTNNYTSKLLAENRAEEGLVVIAAYQHQGRGQMINTWESDNGKNLLMSVLLCPDFLPVQQQFLLSKVIALGVRDMLRLFVEGVSIKWPNDVYVGNRKIAGILIENSIMGYTIGSSIAGIGVNINQLEFKSDAPNPVSLTQLLGREFDIDELLGLLCDSIDSWYVKLRKGAVESINLSYAETLYRLGVEATYRDGEGEYKGAIVGVNSIGQLQILPVKGKLKTYHFKEVTFL